MRLTVHRVDVSMFRGDDRLARWREHHFDEQPRRAVEHESGRETLWSRSQPFEVEAPSLSRLEDVNLPRNEKYRPTEPPARRRLVTPTDKWGLDATNVLHLAVRGANGFSMAKALPAPAEIPTATPFPRLDPDPSADAFYARFALPTDARWGIAFAPRSQPHYRSFLAAASVAPWDCIASTLDLSSAAIWIDPGQAGDWMRGAGLDPERPIPIAWGLLYPSLAPLPAKLDGEGQEFELSRASTEMLAARVNAEPELLLQEIVSPVSKPLETKRLPARTKTLVGQLAFSW